MRKTKKYKSLKRKPLSSSGDHGSKSGDDDNTFHGRGFAAAAAPRNRRPMSSPNRDQQRSHIRDPKEVTIRVGNSLSQANGWSSPHIVISSADVSSGDIGGGGDSNVLSVPETSLHNHNMNIAQNDLNKDEIFDSMARRKLESRFQEVKAEDGLTNVQLSTTKL